MGSRFNAIPYAMKAMLLQITVPPSVWAPSDVRAAGRLDRLVP
jgi:hypothetical protein